MRYKGHDLDLRLAGAREGQWLNAGRRQGANTIEEARKQIVQERLYDTAKRLRDNRPPVADPAAHLRPFVDFLNREAKNPQQFVLDAIDKHRVVILGEVHDRPRYWAFNAALVRSPDSHAGCRVVYMELPSNDQALVDRFLAAAKYDPEPVIDTLRDMMDEGWPDQPTLDFFRTVWEVNQKLPQPQRLRIVLVTWPGRGRRSRGARIGRNTTSIAISSWPKTSCATWADTRPTNGTRCFSSGYGHAMVNLTWPGGEPMKSAGWHLREKLGPKNVFAMFPQSPVITNSGQVHGRIALGLFDTAFAALGNKPMAFPLDHGPFGQQLFDADPERLTNDPFSKGYQGYLYLGPVEDEILSPLIPGFYTDEFVREVDRRWRLHGKGLVESGLIKRLDGASYAALKESILGPAAMVGRSTRPTRRLALRQPFSGCPAEASAVDPSHHRESP